MTRAAIEQLESRRFLSLAGDANNDARVDSEDFTIQSLHFGQHGPTVGRRQGDFTNDHAVNATDFGVLASNFGAFVSTIISPAAFILKPSGQMVGYFAGADTDAARGTALLAAVSAWATNEAIVVGAGDFNIAGSGIAMVSGGVLRGAGINRTRIISTREDQVGPIIQAATNSETADLTIEGTVADFQIPWGVNSAVGSPAAFTDAVIRNVRIINDTDGIFVNHTTACSFRAYGLDLQCKYDAASLTLGTGGIADIYDMRIKNLGGSATGTASRGLLVGATGTVNIFGSNIDVSDTQAAQQVRGVEATGGTLNLFGTKVTAINLGAGGATKYRNSGGIINIDNPPIGLKVSTAQFDRTATTTITTSGSNITGLTVDLAAGRTYRFKATLFYAADATGGHKYAISGTVTPTNIIYHTRTIDDATDALIIAARHVVLTGASGQAGSVAGMTIIEGVITVDPEGQGTLTVRFAQNVASGTSSILVGSTFDVQLIE